MRFLQLGVWVARPQSTTSCLLGSFPHPSCAQAVTLIILRPVITGQYELQKREWLGQNADSMSGTRLKRCYKCLSSQRGRSHPAGVSGPGIDPKSSRTGFLIQSALLHDMLRKGSKVDDVER